MTTADIRSAARGLDVARLDPPNSSSGRPAAASVVTLTPVRALLAGEHGFRLVANRQLVRLRLRSFYGDRLLVA